MKIKVEKGITTLNRKKFALQEYVEKEDGYGSWHYRTHQFGGTYDAKMYNGEDVVSGSTIMVIDEVCKFYRLTEVGK